MQGLLSGSYAHYKLFNRFWGIDLHFRFDSSHRFRDVPLQKIGLSWGNVFSNFDLGSKCMESVSFPQRCVPEGVTKSSRVRTFLSGPTNRPIPLLSTSQRIGVSCL